MKVELNKADFLEMVSNVTGIINGKAIRPDANWVMLETDGEVLVAHAVNGSVGVRDMVDASVVEAGCVVVDGVTLARVANGVSRGDVTLTSDEKFLHIKNGANRTKIALVAPGDEMPIMHFGEEQKTGTSMVITALCGALSDVRYAMSTDNTRVSLTGVYVNLFDDERADIVALDGYRIALSKIYYNGDKIASFIIPARSVNEICKLFGNREGYVEMVVDDGWLFLRNGGTTFETVLLEGTFIDYQRVLPKEFNTTVQVNAKEYKEALKRAAGMTDEKSKIVRLEIGGGKVVVTGGSTIGSSVDELDAKIEGEGNLRIAFNVKYLLDCAKQLYSEVVVFGVNGATKPVMFNDGDNKHVCLPVRELG